MARWSILKAAINSIIKENNNREITGQALQNVLNNIISTLGENATFAGVATFATNPGLNGGPIFYTANTAGIYSNFGGAELKEGEVAILYWNSVEWAKITVVHPLVQAEGNSANKVMSQKAVTQALNDKINGIYDREVLLTQDEFDALGGNIDSSKIYYIYEDDEEL